MSTGINRKDVVVQELNAIQASIRGSNYSRISDISQNMTFDKILGFIFEPLIAQYALSTWKTCGLDIVSSLTSAFTSFPMAIAFSLIAGVPVGSGLVSAIGPTLIYSFFGASRSLVVGPDILISLFIGIATRREFSLHGTPPSETAARLSLIVGIFCFILSFVKYGFLDNIFPGFIWTGFITGMVIFILAEQFPRIFGVTAVVSGNIPAYEKLKQFFIHLDTCHYPSLATGILSLVGIFLFLIISVLISKRFKWFRRFPILILYFLLVILLSATLDFQSKGIATFFNIKISAPPIKIPYIDYDIIGRLAPDVLIITIFGYIQMQSVTRKFSLMHGYKATGERELFSIGMANLIGSCFGAFPTFGRMIPNEFSHSNVTAFSCGIIVLILSFVIFPILTYLPVPTLSTLNFLATLMMLDFQSLRILFKVRLFNEIVYFAVTFIITVTLQPSVSILLCGIFSIIVIVNKISYAHFGILGEIKDNNKCCYVEITERQHDARLLKGVSIFNIKGPFVFYNARSFPKLIRSIIKMEFKLHNNIDTEEAMIWKVVSSPAALAKNSDLKQVVSENDAKNKKFIFIIDFTSCDEFDSSALIILEESIKALKSLDSIVYFTGLNEDQKHIIMLSGGLDILGKENIFDDIESAVKSFPNIHEMIERD